MIKNKSTYSYKFNSAGLTKSKFEQINLVCNDYLKLKNEVSDIVYNNHLFAMQHLLPTSQVTSKHFH